MKITLKSRSASETKRIGKKIGSFLSDGDVVALSGELGSGKTTLVKGIAKGLGLKDENEVTSPTFTLVHEYDAREKIYHMDWYRLNEISAADQAFLEEYFESGGVCLVEWADRAKRLLPRRRLSIHLQHSAKGTRTMKLDSSYPGHDWMRGFK